MTRQRTIAACHKSVADEMRDGIESAVQSIWLQLDCLGLADRALVEPHRRGLVECREKIQAILRSLERGHDEAA